MCTLKGADPLHPRIQITWLVRNANSKTTCGADIYQTQAYQVLQDYNTHQEWRETDVPGQSYKQLHFPDYLKLLQKDRQNFIANTCLTYYYTTTLQVMLCFYKFTFLNTHVWPHPQRNLDMMSTKAKRNFCPLPDYIAACSIRAQSHVWFPEE